MQTKKEIQLKDLTIAFQFFSTRILLLGRTGVGKSSLGNQLFGDLNTFAVGHQSSSKTETISWASNHYLGTGKCITIIDTPGTKDTEGRNPIHKCHKFNSTLLPKLQIIGFDVSLKNCFLEDLSSCVEFN